jgi:hypothetical protein
MKTRTSGLVALAVVLVLAGVAAGIVASRASTSEASAPLQVDGVPESIPAEGVTLMAGVADVTLMPAPAGTVAGGDAAAPISAADAVSLAPKVKVPSPPMTVLAIVTVGSSLPPAGESAEGYRPIQDRLAWVVVYTHPEPFDARISGKRHGSTAPPIMMSRSNFIIDAQTGEFLGGFFTK